MMLIIIIGSVGFVKPENEMRISKAQAQANRDKVVGAASELFRAQGFENVTVSEVMEAAGFTHGGFYNHFASKEALMAESFLHAAQASGELMASKTPDAAGRAAYLAAYLSPAHRDAPGSGCPIAALSAEIARAPGVRGAYTTHIRGTMERLAAYFPWSSKRHARRDAIAALSALVGALTLARAVDDEELSEEILRETLAALKT